MASYTSNLNLIMPTTSERFDILNFNQNAQKIDDGYGTLNNNIANLTDYMLLDTSTASTIEGAVADACTYFNSNATISSNRTKTYVVAFMWSGHAYLQGTMRKLGNDIIFNLSSDTKAYFGSYNISTLFANVKQVALNSDVPKKKTITGTTNGAGILNVASDSVAKANIYGIFVVSPNNAFAVPESGDNIRIYAGSNSSTTDDPIKMIVNTSVTVNVLYF